MQNSTSIDSIKDDFIFIISHKLQTPMTAIKGYLAMLLNGDAGEISPKAKEFLQKAYDSNEQMIEVVRNLSRESIENNAVNKGENL